MKANEAPEKIYFDGEDKACKLPVFSSCNIEYTRTDAFIEKACAWLKGCLDNGMWIANDVGVAEKEAIIENFKKYMGK